MDLVTSLEKYRAEERGLSWQGTFAEYFDLVLTRPQLARLSHARVYDMIVNAGVEEDGDHKSYQFFEHDLFGMEKPLQQIVEYFHSSARRLEVRKRILLLMGPVGGGKSTIVTLLKRGLEAYTRSEQGAVYAIQGCPMHEEPLHLDARSPAARHREVSTASTSRATSAPPAAICCRRNTAARLEDVLVQRISFSEKSRVGIGTFSPSDPKSQDISELTGSIDLSTIGEYGVESDPRAYRFDGELNIANRGLMEFIEMLKSDEKFLYGLLTLSQEQSIKTGRFSMIYADEVIVSHTNENEYSSLHLPTRRRKRCRTVSSSSRCRTTCG